MRILSNFLLIFDKWVGYEEFFGERKSWCLGDNFLSLVFIFGMVRAFGR